MKRIVIFLLVTFALTWGYEFGVVYPLSSGSIAGVPPIASQLAVGAAMFFPAIGVLVTRLVTREGFKNSVIKPRNLKKAFPWFLVAWFGPAILCALGVVVYFLVDPQDFDPSLSATIAAIQQQVAATSGDAATAATPTPALSDDLMRTMLLAQIPVALFLGPALNIFTTFGEEWGWRGYLVPKMATRMSIVPNMLVTGVIWGLWHAPIIALGHNYGMGYFGWPFSGIAAMCVFCITLGIFFTYVTERTGSCLAAAIGHGAVNAFAGASAFFSFTGGNPFLGPAPTGIVGGSALIAVAALMLWDMRRREKVGTLNIPPAGLPNDARRG